MPPPFVPSEGGREGKKEKRRRHRRYSLIKKIFVLSYEERSVFSYAISTVPRMFVRGTGFFSVLLGCEREHARYLEYPDWGMEVFHSHLLMPGKWMRVCIAESSDSRRRYNTNSPDRVVKCGLL